MKKTVIALFLCLVLAGALVLPAAAETCYTLMQAYLYNSEYSGELCLGDPYAVIETEGLNNVMCVGICMDGGFVTLSGTNVSGKEEATVWQGLEPERLFIVAYSLFSMWDIIHAQLDDGYTLRIALFFCGEDGVFNSEEDPYLYADTAEEAAQILAAFDAGLTVETGEEAQ